MGSIGETVGIEHTFVAMDEVRGYCIRIAQGASVYQAERLILTMTSLDRLSNPLYRLSSSWSSKYGPRRIKQAQFAGRIARKWVEQTEVRARS